MNIEPFETAWHLISILLVFLLGLVIVFKIKTKLGLPTKMVLVLYFWHTIFSVIYMSYTLSNGGDSTGYYFAALNGDIELEFGTRLVEYFVFILVSYLDLSYLGLFLFFNIFGSIALIILYKILSDISKSCTRKIRRLATLSIFLPSASFWTSALGKDSIAFLAVCLALWAALNLQKRKVLIGIAITLLLLVRPHMAGVMVLALAGSILFTRSNVSLLKRIILGAVVIPIAAILVPFASNYAGIENLSDINEVGGYVESRQASNLDGGSSVDIANMIYPAQVFTYLFRPLPFEAHSLFSFISSIDNLFLLCVFLYAIRYIKSPSNTKANHAFLWLYVILSTSILAMTTANLGIAVRQKWMILPILMYLLFAMISAYQTSQNKRIKPKKHTHS